MTTCSIRARLGALAVAALAPLAHAAGAAPTHTIAVLSLVGDKIDVVSFQVQVGRLLDTNRHQLIPFAAAGLDYVALGAAKSVLNELDPSADVALLAASKPESYEPQGKMFDGDRVALPAEIDAAVHREHATSLLLVTKYRTEARLNLADGAMGSGKLEGLGFYVDDYHEMINGGTGGTSTGFIAPYAYIQLSLVDVASGTVLRKTTVTESWTAASGHHEDGEGAWSVLTPTEKGQAMKKILDRAVQRHLPSLFTPAKP